MNDQEAFNRIVTHLRLQGRKSLNPNEGSCVYRSFDGARCAVGVLITDEFYHSDLEGKTVDDEYVRAVLKEAVPGVSLGLLNAMQAVHDTCSVAKWEEHFTYVAHQYNLTMLDKNELIPRLLPTGSSVQPECEPQPVH